MPAAEQILQRFFPSHPYDDAYLKDTTTNWTLASKRWEQISSDFNYISKLVIKPEPLDITSHLFEPHDHLG